QPSPSGKQAPPSGAGCHSVPPTSRPERATTLPVNPAGSARPSAPGGPSGPYGLSPGATLATAARCQSDPGRATAPRPAETVRRNVRRCMAAPEELRREGVQHTMSRGPDPVNWTGRQSQRPLAVTHHKTDAVVVKGIDGTDREADHRYARPSPPRPEVPPCEPLPAPAWPSQPPWRPSCRS